MKKEVLRMEHILCRDGEVNCLNYLSMQIFKGEVYGMLCLEQLGIEKLVELICWNRPIQGGQVFINDKLVNRVGLSDASANRVAVVERNNKLIDELSLADNLFVIRTGFDRFLIPSRLIYSETQKLFDDLELDFDPLILVQELGNYERLVVEVLRAVITGAHLIILWEISDLLSSEEQPHFHKLIRKLAARGHTFLYIYSHHEVLQLVIDRLAVFSGGAVKRVIEEKELRQEMSIQIYARYAYERITHLSVSANERDGERGRPTVLEMRHISTEHIQDFNIQLRQAEIVLLFDRSNTIADELIGVLSGVQRAESGQLLPRGLLTGETRQIALITRDPINSTLFPEMSFIDNLCMPLADKTKHFWQKPRLKRSVMHECRGELGDLLDATTLYDLPKKDLYTLVYYRYLLSKPKVVFCQQPLSNTDIYLRVHILRLITRLRESGIAVLILTTELYDSLQIADRMLQIEHGRLSAEYSRAQFDEVFSVQSEQHSD